MSSMGYSYDSVGNRTQKVVGGSVTTYAYAANSNRLTTLQGAPVPSDANGSITNNGTASFNYDARGRMVSANTAIGQVGYKINALGQRVQKVTPQSSTVYHYDIEGRLLAESSDKSTTEYAYLDGMPVAMLLDAGQSPSVLYVHTDQLNTPRLLSDQAGTAVWRWDSDGFGYAAANEQASGQAPVRMNLRFPGQYFDSESNLHYNYYRDYDPQTGRYIQSDPIGLDGGINTYAYVGNNPVRFIDPLGLQFRLPRFLVPGAPMQSGQNGGVNDFSIPSLGKGDSGDGCCENYTDVYEPNDGKHGSVPRGDISAEPQNPHLALLASAGVGKSRLGYDGLGGQIVVFRLTRIHEQKCIRYWHGYVVYQRDLTPEQWKAGRDAGFPNWPRKPK